jgi:hypothetical protein
MLVENYCNFKLTCFSEVKGSASKVNMKGRFKIKLYLSINRNMHEIACYGQKLPTSNKPFLNIFNDYQKYFYL